MSNVDQAPEQTDSTVSGGGASEIRINPLIISRSDWAFRICLISFIGFLFLLFLPPIVGAITGDSRFFVGISVVSDNVFIQLAGSLFPYVSLFFITVISAYIGYKLVVASGASPENPIPPANYRLLAPLITDGKAESIDQYVRLSSLSGFTGTFTKLGLTGLPLTTVILTLIFAIIALLPVDAESKKSFMDLTKLTLGAFIGSFVQRQVEQRKEIPASGVKGDESRVQ
jgi:hypothetical protein